MLILPESVDRQLRLEAALDQDRLMAEKTHAVAVALSQLDDRLILVPPSAPRVDGMLPGYWYVVRRNDEGKATYWPVDDPHTGEPIEPGSGFVERFRAMNAWERRVEEDRARARVQAKRDREHAEAQLRGEMRDEMLVRAKAKLQPGVSFSDGPWAWRHKHRHKTTRGGVLLP